MDRFPLHTIQTAPAAARPVLQRLVDGAPGSALVLNLWAAMAESPLALETYAAMRRSVELHATLDARVRSAISIAVGGAIGGRYSPVVNTRIATRAGWTPDEIEALRRGVAPDAPLDALLALAREAATDVGRVSDATWSAALAAGWTPAELGEAFTIVALVAFVDGFAAFADIELDEAFRRVPAA